MKWRVSKLVYTIQLNGKKYGVDVSDAVAHIVEMADLAGFSNKKENLFDKLPDFDFSEEKAENTDIVHSTMPGSIVSVCVVIGQKVKAGEMLAILESMKMETVISATRDGRVVKVNIRQGDIIKIHQELFEIGE